MAASFSCDAGAFTIDACLCGQAPLPMYDPLAQIALRPNLREGTILCYKDTSVEGIFSQLQASVGADNRTVTTNPFYWTEKCNEPTNTLCVKRAAAASSPGGTIIVDLDKSSMSTNGRFSKPKQGVRVYIKELDGQGAIIESVDRSVTGQHRITLRALNNEILDLTRHAKYTMLMDTLRMYKKCDDNCIKTDGFLLDPPTLRKSYVQKFEAGYCIKEDELDGYAYDQDFYVIKGIDPLTGRAVENYCIPTVNNKLLSDWFDSRIINTLFGQRNDADQTGFDGLIPTAQQSGMYNYFYDPSSGASLKQMLFGMIRNLRRTNGCNEYMILHDMGFAMDWSDAIAALVRESGQNLNFSLFGKGGSGVQNFEWFEFKNFAAFGHKFMTYLIDAFDAYRYGNFLKDFGIMLPACKFKDTNGKIVPAVTYVYQTGCEPAKVKHLFSYDERQRGCRVWNVFLKDEFGMEIHCPSKLGTMRRMAC
ncbi:hypothetical protein PV783_34265 [Chitinophaga sp. CC14]|uniref:hypothetical protein n=1 Tax=Chitinophaga sp. CC14 TaxID=3029199 RepID=UPI003B7C0264